MSDVMPILRCPDDSSCSVQRHLGGWIDPCQPLLRFADLLHHDAPNDRHSDDPDISISHKNLLAVPHIMTPKFIYDINLDTAYTHKVGPRFFATPHGN